MLLTVDQLSKSFGDHLVLHQVALTLARGQKVGLVGANGVGKSTLLKIITGELEADGGSVHIAPTARIGYLPQVLAAADDLTLDELIESSLGPIRGLERQMRALEQTMGHADGNLAAVMDEYAQVAEEFERQGGYDLDYRLETVLTGLRVAHLPRNRRVGTLSGGEKSRVGLAVLLLQAPDLLLLDEPTNHLDFAALTWLEEYLQSFRGGLLAVSHDRHFLNAVVDTIVEIAEHSKQANIYPGSYDAYAARKRQERVKWEAEYWTQQEEIWELRRVVKGKARQVAHTRPPRDGDKFLAYFKSERIAEAISRNVRAAEEKLRRLEADPIPRPPRPLEINPEFDPAALASHTAILASGIAKRFGDLKLFEDTTLAVGDASRIVIVGPNGAGKSTLLRILAGVDRPDAGEVMTAPTAVLGYLDQEQQGLDPMLTLFESFRDGRPGEYEEFKAELLGYGLFTYPDLDKRVGTLSVGQQRKLQLACLLTRRANVLLLDEPTNHISLDVLEEFEAALANFRGPIVAVSHDRHFIARFATEIWELVDGGVVRHLGGWETYQARHHLAPAAPVQTAA